MSNRNIGAGSKRFTPRRNVGTLPPGLGGINKDVGRKVALFGTYDHLWLWLYACTVCDSVWLCLVLG